MKIPLRRPATTTPDPDERPAPPRPPRGRPVVQYAGVLDGRRLWLALAPEAGSPGLRDTASGEVLVPPAELAEDEPGWRSFRLDLDAVAWADGTAYELVLAGAGGRGARPLWSPPLALPRTAPTAEGTHRYRLERNEDGGGLRLHRRALEPAAELQRVEVLAHGTRLTLTAPTSGAPTSAAPGSAAPDGPGALSLVADDGSVLASYPASVDAGALTVTITVDPLPADVDVRTRVLLDGPSGDRAAVPVRRRADDLPDAGRGAPLPAYESDDGPVVALRWGPDGLLTARVRPAEETR